MTSPSRKQFQTTPAIVELWHEFARTRARSVRDKLITHYLPAADYHACRVHSRLPSHVDFDDLQSSGVVGLIHAIDTFDVSRGWRFETFAAQRIRGQMIDDMRSTDWVSRLVRRRAAQYTAARDDLINKLGHAPSDLELMEAMNVTPAEYGRIHRDADVKHKICIHADETGDDCPLSEMIPQRREPDHIADVDQRDLLATMLAALPPRQRAIMGQLYIDHRQQDDVAAEMGYSPGRVSQWHHEAIEVMRSTDAYREALNAAA